MFLTEFLSEMAIVRTLIILALVGLILGGSAFLPTSSIGSPRKLDMEDKATSSQAPGAVPDYTLPAFEKGSGSPTDGRR